MYWQKKFAQPEVPDKREQIILAIRKEHKDYGYRRLWAHMRNLGDMINHKAVQRIVQKLELQVHSFTRKSRRYSSYRGTVGNIADNLLKRRFKTCIPHQKITTDTRFTMGVFTIATRNSKQRLRSMLSTTTSAASRSLSAG